MKKNNKCEKINLVRKTLIIIFIFSAILSLVTGAITGFIAMFLAGLLLGILSAGRYMFDGFEHAHIVAGGLYFYSLYFLYNIFQEGYSALSILSLFLGITVPFAYFEIIFYLRAKCEDIDKKQMEVS